MAVVMGIASAHAIRLKVPLCLWLSSGVYAIIHLLSEQKAG
jgi:hypothetical protein